MKLNNYIKNSDYTGEKQLPQTYIAEINVPRGDFSGILKVYEKSVTIPTGKFILDLETTVSVPSANINATFTDPTFFIGDYFESTHTNWLFDIYVAILGQTVTLVVRGRSHKTDYVTPASQIKLKVRLSEPPF